MDDKMQKIVSLAKRRGFIFPSSEIYGGLANSFDYGPLGVELKNNIKQEWWKRFVHQRTDVVGIDSALLMNPKVWEASGHLKNFSDPLVECKKCHNRFRADQLEGNACLECGGKEFTPARNFNLMLKTFLGPTEDAANAVYFRPETAQAMFIDFKTILDTNHLRVPFGIAQIGKAFRNEITPGNFIFRTREFEQMEIEYFVEEKDWKKYFDHWLGEMKQWLKDLGVKEKNIEYVEIPDNERAHYSKRTIDIEYKYPFGQKELYGLAYRGDFDLKNHFPNDASWPHVIEPSFGVDRSVLVALLEAYTDEELKKKERKSGEEIEDTTRVVLKFPAWLAPVKVAILPLLKKEKLVELAKKIHMDLSKKFVVEYDETQSIGKRYRRQDEIGTPLAVTIDFESLEDKKVTLRDRDTMKQERIEIKNLTKVIEEKLHV